MLRNAKKCFWTITEIKLWAKFTPRLDYTKETLIFQLLGTNESDDVFEKDEGDDKSYLAYAVSLIAFSSTSRYLSMLRKRQIQIWLHKRNCLLMWKKNYLLNEHGGSSIWTVQRVQRDSLKVFYVKEELSIPCFSSSFSRVHKLFQRYLDVWMRNVSNYL